MAKLQPKIQNIRRKNTGKILKETWNGGQTFFLIGIKQFVQIANTAPNVARDFFLSKQSILLMLPGKVIESKCILVMFWDLVLFSGNKDILYLGKVWKPLKPYVCHFRAG